MREETLDLDLLQKVNLFPKWRIIITSRLPIAWAENYEVEKLDLEAAPALFRGYCSHTAIANELLFKKTLSLLNGNPLIIELIAKHANIMNFLDLTNLCVQLTTKPPEASLLKAASTTKLLKHNNEESIVHGLMVCFNKIKGSAAPQKTLLFLKYLAVLPNNLWEFSYLKEILCFNNIFTVNELKVTISYLFTMGWLVEIDSSFILKPTLADYIFYYKVLPLSETEKIEFITPLILYFMQCAEENKPEKLKEIYLFLFLIPRINILIDGLKTNEIVLFYEKIVFFLKIFRRF